VTNDTSTPRETKDRWTQPTAPKYLRNLVDFPPVSCT
jgi:hypothetical protein